MNKLYPALITILAFALVLGVSMSVNNRHELQASPVEQKLILDSTNTPPEIKSSVVWNELDYYANPSRYTEMHYRHVVKASGYHVALVNYGSTSLIENSEPIYGTYTITANVESLTWSELTYTSGGDEVITILATPYWGREDLALARTLAFTTSSPYFTLVRTHGAAIYIKSIVIDYTCL